MSTSSAGGGTDREPLSLYVFGDSICFGQYVSPHQTWVGRLSAALDEAYGSKILVQNCSVNGDTTRMALERLTFDVVSHRPTFALIQFGLNDSNFWESDHGVPRVSLETFAANIAEIIERLRAAGTKLIFVNNNHPSLKGPYPHLPHTVHSQVSSIYNLRIRNLANSVWRENRDIVFNDVENFWLEKVGRNFEDISPFLMDDGIHLSLAGHKIYFEQLGPIVGRKIEEFLQ